MSRLRVCSTFFGFIYSDVLRPSSVVLDLGFEFLCVVKVGTDWSLCRATTKERRRQSGGCRRYDSEAQRAWGYLDIAPRVYDIDSM